MIVLLILVLCVALLLIPIGLPGIWLMVAARYTKKYGGSSRAAWGALIGGVVGAMVGVPMPIIGSVIGALAGSFVGALLGEYSTGTPRPYWAV
ncbi:hypothetical protein LBMAG44_13690 [Gemmatimonadota bacterium]|nr:hypothetical protein LBMAG44_13690 [Gemmatimonadota bacterium]